jgi:hypothetical protein
MDTEVEPESDKRLGAQKGRRLVRVRPDRQISAADAQQAVKDGKDVASMGRYSVKLARPRRISCRAIFRLGGYLFPALAQTNKGAAMESTGECLHREL